MQVDPLFLYLKIRAERRSRSTMIICSGDSIATASVTMTGRCVRVIRNGVYNMVICTSAVAATAKIVMVSISSSVDHLHMNVHCTTSINVAVINCYGVRNTPAAATANAPVAHYHKEVKANIRI
jgi:hypothetical protein